MKQKQIIISVVIVLVLIVAGILLFNTGSESLDLDSSNDLEFDSASSQEEGVDWRTLEFVDVSTGEKFRISDFEGKPVLLESFAVWCPTCKKQQDEMKKLHEKIGDSVISISLDTDPNEDAQKVLNHLQKHGYEWFFAISPPDATQSLIEEFGTGFVNAPSAPVVLIDKNQSANLLRAGVKSTDELLSEINI